MDTITYPRIRQKGRADARAGLRELAKALLIVALAGSAIFVTVWRRVAFIDVGYEIRSLESRESRLLALQRELEIEKAMLTSPERIEEIARRGFGLTDPEPGQIRKLP